jgi:4-amino-4-deoxy-L-arabinose transferase-like glycosyltransferase
VACLALVGLITVLVMFANLGGPRLWDRDEPRNAGCAREMLDRNDWVVPTFNGELRTHKPVLLYWCMMSAYRVFGVSEFAARLPSALCALITVVCTYAIGGRLFGTGAGTWSAVVLGSSLLFVMAGRAATPDSLLIACTTLAITIYVLGTVRPADVAASDAHSALVHEGHWFPQRWLTVVAMSAAMGLAVLAKGPVGVLLPCAVIGLFLLIMRLPAVERRPVNSGSLVRTMLRPFGPRHFLTTLWSMRPLTLIAVVTAVALPWYWTVGVATQGEFPRAFLLEHNLHRATGVMEGHDGNLLFYPAAILVGFFPWSIFAVPLVLDLRAQQRSGTAPHPGIVLATCWMAVYVASFSAARTKLPNYITPCFPALAVLTGSYVSRWSREATAGQWLRIGLGCYALVGAAFTVAMPLVARRYLPGEEWLGLIGLVPLCAGGLCLWLATRQKLLRTAVVFASSAVAFTTLIFTVGAQRVDGHQQSGVLLQAIHSSAVDPRIASYEILEPSWVFYSGQSIAALPRRPSGPGAVASPAEQVVQFLQAEPEGFVITRLEQARALEAVLPPGVVVLAEADRFLSTQRLVVLGRPAGPNDEEPRSPDRHAAAASNQRF